MKKLIHESSDVQTNRIGEGTTIWQYVVILKDASIGKNCNINANVFIENDVIIGNNVTIKCGVQLWDGIRIGNDSFIGPNSTFVNNPYPRSKKYPLHIGVKLGNNVSVGASATIMGNITIEDFAMVGAASLVTKNIGKNELWYGSPAKKMGFVTNEGIILNLNLYDNKNNYQYEWRNNFLIIQK
tara:strand:+ start:105 stop:656 length:552 start_codon:yes stop_codon:yes gene_type:complete